MDAEKYSCRNDAAAVHVQRLRGEADRRLHRYQRALPISFDDRLPYRRADSPQEKRGELEAIRRSGLSSSSPSVAHRSGGRNAQPKNPTGTKSTAITNGIVVPMWMAGDSFMVAWGRVNAQPMSLFFVDSGLAGASRNRANPQFSKPASSSMNQKPTEGQGGGGILKIIPYTVAQFTVGEIPEQNVPGLYAARFLGKRNLASPGRYVRQRFPETLRRDF